MLMATTKAGEIFGSLTQVQRPGKHGLVLIDLKRPDVGKLKNDLNDPGWIVLKGVSHVEQKWEPNIQDKSEHPISTQLASVRVID